MESEPEKTAPANEAEEVSHNLKIEDLRVVASKLAGQGKQADLKQSLLSLKMLKVMKFLNYQQSKLRTTLKC